MVKKFSFNFKFLDRFKKKKNEEDLNLNEEVTQDNESSIEDDEPISFQEMQRPDKSQSVTEANFSNNDTEYESAESSEEFAEKTLSGFKMPTQESIDSSHLTNHKEISKSDISNPFYQTIENTEIESPSDKVDDENVVYQEMQPPTKPEEVKKFKFNFPSFNRDSFGNFKASNLKNSFQKIEKLNWNEIIQKIFSPYSRGKIHNLFLILLVISFTYLLGKSFALFTNRTTKIDIKSKSTINIPAEGVDTSLTDINKITATNLFNASENENVKPVGPKINIAEIVCVDADRPTTSPMKLLDTIVLQDSVKSVASVQVRGSQDLMNIREGEKIDNIEISKIKRMKLILKNLETGDCEYLSTEKEDELVTSSPIKILPASQAKSIFKSMNPSIKNEGNNFKIKKKYRDEMVTKMSDILTQAKAIQITNPDGTMCFKMTEVVPGSIYTQLNIQENDIVCNINGRKIDNLNELMGLLGRIKEVDSMQIGLKRNGMQENLEYGFE
jgi:type II secretion system protein C